MTQQKKDSKRTNKKAPQVNDIAKQKEKQKAGEQEVAGRHKNDGQKPFKGRR